MLNNKYIFFCKHFKPAGFSYYFIDQLIFNTRYFAGFNQKVVTVVESSTHINSSHAVGSNCLALKKHWLNKQLDDID